MCLEKRDDDGDESVAGDEGDDAGNGERDDDTENVSKQIGLMGIANANVVVESVAV